MKKVLIPSITAALLCMGVASTANAGTPYVGAGAGSFSLNDGTNKKSTVGGYVKVGHDFYEYLGGEVRGGLSGSTKEENVVTPVPANQIDFFVAALLKPQYHFTEQVSVYGLLGGGLINATQTPVGGVKRDKSKAGVAYGAGFNVGVMDNFAVTAEWLHIGSKPKAAVAGTFNGLSADMYTGSVEYHF